MAQEASEASGQERPEPGTFCWTEVAVNDAAKAKEFFTNVFGWKFKEGNAGGMEYNEFTTGSGGPQGGLYELDPKWFSGDPPPPHLMTYIAVENVDENARRAEELGGKLIRVEDIPNAGRIAMIEDPTGAKFATYQMQESGGENG